MTLNRHTVPERLPLRRKGPARVPPGGSDSAAGAREQFKISSEVAAALAARAAGHPAGADRPPAQDPAGEPVLAQLLALAPARRIRLELMVVADRLVAEFAGHRTAGGVLRCVAGCRADLRGSGLTAGLPEAVDRLARQRLTEQTDGQSAASGSARVRT